MMKRTLEGIKAKCLKFKALREAKKKAALKKWKIKRKWEIIFRDEEAFYQEASEDLQAIKAGEPHAPWRVRVHLMGNTLEADGNRQYYVGRYWDWRGAKETAKALDEAIEKKVESLDRLLEEIGTSKERNKELITTFLKER